MHSCIASSLKAKGSTIGTRSNARERVAQIGPGRTSKGDPSTVYEHPACFVTLYDPCTNPSTSRLQPVQTQAVLSMCLCPSRAFA
eukprot:16397075-Heterocapsa_arctica.AAC.1